MGISTLRLPEKESSFNRQRHAYERNMSNRSTNTLLKCPTRSSDNTQKLKVSRKLTKYQISSNGGGELTIFAVAPKGLFCTKSSKNNHDHQFTGGHDSVFCTAVGCPVLLSVSAFLKNKNNRNFSGIKRTYQLIIFQAENIVSPQAFTLTGIRVSVENQ